MFMEGFETGQLSRALQTSADDDHNHQIRGLLAIYSQKSLGRIRLKMPRLSPTLSPAIA
jgi:hypothetical protein